MLFEDTGTWRDLATGVDPAWGDPTLADASTAHPGTPGEPINTRLEGPWGLPWWDGLEDPSSPTGLLSSPDPTYPEEDKGKKAIAGAYEGAFRTHGPVVAWGHEASGGYWGNQAVGRIMRFPANIPERFDPDGVANIDYRDELAAAIQMNGQSLVSDTALTDDLVNWPRSSY